MKTVPSVDKLDGRVNAAEEPISDLKGSATKSRQAAFGRVILRQEREKGEEFECQWEPQREKGTNGERAAMCQNQNWGRELGKQEGPSGSQVPGTVTKRP